MKRILLVAEREFVSTVATRGFIVGALVAPFIFGLLIMIMPWMLRDTPPSVRGEVAIVDPTGVVTPAVKAYLEPARLAERRERSRRMLQAAMPSVLRSTGTTAPAADQAIETALGEVPLLDVLGLGADADVEAEKAKLFAAPVGPGGSRLAVVVIQPDAITRREGGGGFGGYELFVRSKLDDRIEREVSEGVREAIVAARFAESGLDRERISELARVERVTSRTVTAAGEGATNRVLNQLMPAAFMALLLISVMMSGQYLLTTTVEEKSNRIVEVLLSAVSPVELMAGKVIGQMGVGLLVLGLYLGLGLAALMSFASLGLIDPLLIVFLIIFYVLAFVTVGAFMAAAGAAVNELREAQSLMTPIMLIVMIPWLLWMPISRDPSSTFATVMSFLPPVSNFVMMLRMASTTPPPMWQPLLAIPVGLLGALASLWFAGKVFRIGLLMFGKPPNIATLVRWARMS